MSASIAIAAGRLIIDEFDGADGRVERLGGAGPYAAFGMQLSSGRGAVLSAQVGDDFDSDLLTEVGLTTAGLTHTDRPTPRIRIDYEGEVRIETPVHGVEHMRDSQVRPDDIPEGLLADCTALYVYTDLTPTFWDELDAALKRAGATPIIVWEHDAYGAVQGDAADLARIATRVDAVSLNESELQTLTGSSSWEGAARALHRTSGTTVVVRLGRQGSIALAEDGAWRVPATSVAQIADPTGAGNAFTGAFAAALAGGTVADALAAGAAAASLIVEAVGLPSLADGGIEDLFGERSREARRRVERMAVDVDSLA